MYKNKNNEDDNNNIIASVAFKINKNNKKKKENQHNKKAKHNDRNKLACNRYKKVVHVHVLLQTHINNNKKF